MSTHLATYNQPVCLFHSFSRPNSRLPHLNLLTLFYLYILIRAPEVPQYSWTSIVPYQIWYAMHSQYYIRPCNGEICIHILYTFSEFWGEIFKYEVRVLFRNSWSLVGTIGGEGERGHVDELGYGEGKVLEWGNKIETQWCRACHCCLQSWCGGGGLCEQQDQGQVEQRRKRLWRPWIVGCDLRCYWGMDFAIVGGKEDNVHQFEVLFWQVSSEWV